METSENPVRFSEAPVFFRIDKSAKEIEN